MYCCCDGDNEPKDKNSAPLTTYQPAASKSNHSHRAKYSFRESGVSSRASSHQLAQPAPANSHQR
jgi:hypothetical protein